MTPRGVVRSLGSTTRRTAATAGVAEHRPPADHRGPTTLARAVSTSRRRQLTHARAPLGSKCEDSYTRDDASPAALGNKCYTRAMSLVRPLTRSDIKGPALYAGIRDDFRKRIIEIKRDRRVIIGDRVSMMFENRHTLMLQVEEMLRAESLTAEAQIVAELEVYNQLMPSADSLSATLFIELPNDADARVELGKLVGSMSMCACTSAAKWSPRTSSPTAPPPTASRPYNMYASRCQPPPRRRYSTSAARSRWRSITQTTTIDWSPARRCEPPWLAITSPDSRA